MQSTRATRLTCLLFALLLITAISGITQAQEKQPQPDSPATNEAPVKATGPRLERAAWHVLRTSYSQNKSPQKIDVITALGTLGRDPAAIRFLEHALADNDPDVRVAAVSTLGQMKARSAIAKLRLALQDREPQVSFAAAKALWNMGDRAGRDIFIQVLQGKRSTSPGMIEAAKKHYLNAHTLALMGVEEGAGAIFGPLGYGVSAIRELASDKGAPARALSAEMLSLDRTPQALRALEDGTGDDNWVVRAAAAEALGNTGDRRVLPTLRTMLDDEKDPVRCMAAAAIIRLQSHQPPRMDIATIPFPQAKR